MSVGYPRRTVFLGGTEIPTPTTRRRPLHLEIRPRFAIDGCNIEAQYYTHRFTCALCRAKQSDGGAEVSAVACGILAMASNINSSSAKSAGASLVLRA